MKYSLPLHALALIAIVALSPYLNAKQEDALDAKRGANVLLKVGCGIG